MKFVDEVKINVSAGNGGDGHLSFLREKYRPFGGPDGGDGGDGGSVYLIASPDINTLVDFRHQRIFKAEDGEKGGCRNCNGKKGEDLWIPVPIGTVVHDANTMEWIGELLEANQSLKVAQGGFHGLGNVRYKSSVNRSPRRTTKGSAGESRELFLELKLLADVGLIGMPNAGKSTLIRAVSAATPKVADYPFTTLHPQLGVVQMGDFNSFVIADIPGLIAGAASGAGLGIRFLKHIMRNRILLHIVDIMPTDGSTPATRVREIEKELAEFSTDLLAKPRWLVFNKIDLVAAKDLDSVCEEIVNELNWTQPVYRVSAATGVGCKQLMNDLWNYLYEL